MGMEFSIIMFLMGNLGFLTGITDAPPMDFASLLQPKAVLEQMNVRTDEATLIKLIAAGDKVKVSQERLKQAVKALQSDDRRARKKAEMILQAAGDAAIPNLETAAKSADPEVKVTAQNLLRSLQQKRAAETKNDTGYVKKLMAIRALQGMKSKSSLPALQAIARGGNPTLSDAAQTAVAIINGEKPKRPTGAATLKQVMTRLPKDLGFVATLDVEKGSKTRTINQFMDEVKKAAEKDPQMKQLAPQMIAFIPMVQKGMAQFIGLSGNVRIDSITFASTRDLATGPGNDAGAVAFIFKGLHDPAMMANALKQEARLKEMKYKKDTVLFERNVAFCSIDQNTFVMAMSDAKDGSQIYPILDAWHNLPNKELDPVHKKAFETVIAGKVRLAAGGMLSDAQKALARPELAKDLQRQKARGIRQPDDKLEIAALEMMVSVIDAKSFFAQADPKLKVTVEAACADAAAAKKLADQVNRVDKEWRNMMAQALEDMKGQQGGGMPAQFKQLFEKMDIKNPMFTANSEDDKATGTVNLLKVAPMWLGAMIPMRAMAQPLHDAPVQVQPQRR
jgi:hypothetical protein